MHRLRAITRSGPLAAGFAGRSRSDAFAPARGAADRRLFRLRPGAPDESAFASGGAATRDTPRRQPARSRRRQFPYQGRSAFDLYFSLLAGFILFTPSFGCNREKISTSSRVATQAIAREY